MENNKVVLSDGTTLIDITDTTAAPETVALGEVFYDAAGVRRVGSANYMALVSNPTAGDVLITDANGQAQDSGTLLTDLATKTYVDGKFAVINWSTTTYAEIRAIAEARTPFWVVDPTLPITDPSVKAFHATQVVLFQSNVVFKLLVADKHYGYTIDSSGQKSRSVAETYALAADLPGQATDSVLGLIKTNPNQSIDLNADGQLTVGGRLGQYPDGGVFYPTTIEPTNVGASSFLMTDGAKNISVGQRTFGIMAGANLTCKSTVAGSTTYRLTNNQTNRFACFACATGRLAIDQNDAIANGTALITDISFADGNPISAYFGPSESDNDIVITVDRTVNPDAATTKLRIYGMSTSNDVINVGQGNGGTHGKALMLGQSCRCSGNQTIAFGNSSIVMANNSVAFGHTHLVNKQFCFAAGQGQDFTNASNGASAVGICSDLKSNTLFAVGNGVFASSGAITRSNAFEVTSDGSIYAGGDKVAVVDSGAVPSTTVNAGSFVDVTVTFAKTFATAPNVVVGLASTSTAADLGSISAVVYSVTTTNATFRVFNNSSNARAPGLYWIATG